jgi:ubiquilin
MADAPINPEIQINVKGPSELKLQISITTDKTVLELKHAIAEKSNVEADRQRLIYSGRVLKDEDVLSVYKIQSTHTIHMVKGVSRAAGSSSQQQAAPQALPTMQSGQNPHDPLTQLNSHMGYGAMAGVNPFAEMGLNANDPNMLQSMMSSPQFLEQMSSVMSNPAIVDQIIASNPQLAAMGPQVREVFQSERFREMISNPERLQQMLQMASMFRDSGSPFAANPFGALGGAAGGGFPAPGVPTTGNAAATPAANAQSAAAPAAAGGFQPFFPAANAGAAAANPFGAIDPAMMQRLLGVNAGGGGFGAGGFGGATVPTAPADTRSPEERFQVPLQQLQDMGFTNASQNVRALLATGGNVHSAIEYILGGGGL